MLLPARSYKTEIENEFIKKFYTDDLMYYNGGLDNWVSEISDSPNDGNYQWAVVDSHNKLVGYICYTIDWHNSTAHRFGIMSFDKGNPLMGVELIKVMRRLIDDYQLHRIEWHMVGGNPVQHAYDKLCEKYHGRRLLLKDVFKDRFGKYHDSYIYELIFDRGNNNG